MVILEDRGAWDGPFVALVVMGTAEAGRAAATGQGSKALGVGPMVDKGNGITVVLPCKRTRLRVLPEGDHINAMFAPNGSGVLCGIPRLAGRLGIAGRGGVDVDRGVVVAREIGEHTSELQSPA